MRESSRIPQFRDRMPPVRMKRTTARWVAICVAAAIVEAGIAGSAYELGERASVGWWGALAVLSLGTAMGWVRTHERPLPRGASSLTGYFGGIDLVLWGAMSLMSSLGAFALTSAVRDDHSARGVGFFFAAANWAGVVVVYRFYSWWWLRSPRGPGVDLHPSGPDGE